MKYIQLFLFFSLLFLSGSSDHTKIEHEIPVEIIIFIHGAISTSWKAPILYFGPFIKDDISGTMYERIVPKIRNDDFFFKNQAMLHLGLVRLYTDAIKKGNAAEGLASLFNVIFEELNGKSVIRRYYTYGWQGHFTKKARRKEAEKLYAVLLNEYNTLLDEGFSPKFKMIGYCHGAQVITELGYIHTKNNQNNEKSLIIDETILLAMPVAPDTVHLLSSPLFKKIYHIFSTKDRLQNIDIFVTKTLLANREIVAHKQLAQKLVQIELKIKQYNHKKPKKSVNFNQTKHIVGHKNRWKNISPGHIELWFFGWTPDNYRKDLLFYPLPALIFIPYILHHIDQEQEFFDPHTKLIADIRPDFEIVLLRQYDAKNQKWRVKLKQLFTKKINMEFLKKMAFSFAPLKYQTLEEHKKRIASHAA